MDQTRLLKSVSFLLLNIIGSSFFALNVEAQITHPTNKDFSENQLKIDKALGQQKDSLLALEKEFRLDIEKYWKCSLTVVFDTSKNLQELDAPSWMKAWFFLDLVERTYKKNGVLFRDISGEKKDKEKDLHRVIDWYRKRLIEALLIKEGADREEFTVEIARIERYWNGITELRWITGEKADKNQVGAKKGEYEFSLMQRMGDEKNHIYRLKYHIFIHRPLRKMPLYGTAYFLLKNTEGFELTQSMDPAHQITPFPGNEVRLSSKNLIKFRMNLDGTLSFYNLPFEFLEPVKGEPFEILNAEANSGKVKITTLVKGARRNLRIAKTDFSKIDDPKFVQPVQVVQLWDSIATSALKIGDFELHGRMLELLETVSE